MYSQVQDRLKNILVKIKNKTLDNKVLLIRSLNLLPICYAVVFGPTIKIFEYDYYGKGYELSKLEFIQIILIISIVVSLIIEIGFLIYSLIKNKTKPKEDSSYFKSTIIYILIILVMLTSSVASEYYYNVSFLDILNPVYKQMFRIFELFGVDTSGSLGIKMSFFGNEFRQQGFITYFLLITCMWLLKNNITKQNMHLIGLSFMISAAIQAAVGISQLIFILQTNPDLIVDGDRIFGDFGQPNFYSGHLIVGLVFTIFYGSHKNLLFKILGIASTLFIVPAIFFSQSYGGILVLSVLLMTITIYELTNPKIFIRYLITLIILGILSVPVFFYVIINKFTPYSLRIDIWKNIIDLYILTPLKNMDDPYQIKNMLFGSGFDTLGEVFQENKVLSTLYIDRGHNFLFNTLAQSGIIGVSILVSFILKPFNNLQPKLSSRIFSYTLIALLMWIFRSMVHTSSIINLFTFFLILTSLYSLDKDTDNNS